MTVDNDAFFVGYFSVDVLFVSNFFRYVSQAYLVTEIEKDIRDIHTQTDDTAHIDGV